MNKKSDYANMVKMRNAKNLKKIQVEKSDSITNPDTNSQPNIATGEHRIANVDPNALNDQTTQSHSTFNEKPNNVRRVNIFHLLFALLLSLFHVLTQTFFTKSKRMNKTIKIFFTYLNFSLN